MFNAMLEKMAAWIVVVTVFPVDTNMFENTLSLRYIFTVVF